MQPASIAFLPGVFELLDAVGWLVALDDVVGRETGMTAFLPSLPRSNVTADTEDVFCNTAPGTYFATVLACDCMPSAYSITVIEFTQ